MTYNNIYSIQYNDYRSIYIRNNFIQSNLVIENQARMLQHS